MCSLRIESFNVFNQTNFNGIPGHGSPAFTDVGQPELREASGQWCSRPEDHAIWSQGTFLGRQWPAGHWTAPDQRNGLTATPRRL